MNRMDNSPIKSWSSDNAVNYYVAHRDSTDKLYRSEKFYLKRAVQEAATILDIGCAAGGFSNIVREYNSLIRYTGIDISPRMIAEARKRFPRDDFYVTDGKNIDFSDNTFDTVICFGVLHMTENWKMLLAEAWRVTKHSLLFDVRLTDSEGISDPQTSYQQLEFEGHWDGSSTAPYIVVNVDTAVQCFLDMRPTFTALKAYGYMHSVSPMTVSTYREVCMAAFWLRKSGSRTPADWDMPILPRTESCRAILNLT